LSNPHDAFGRERATWTPLTNHQPRGTDELRRQCSLERR